MANYYTRGQKHNEFGKDYDCKYNKGYAWNPIFDTLVKDRLTYNAGIRYSDHLKDYDAEGNRTFDTSEISIRNLSMGEVVEIETEYYDRAEDTVEMLRKAVIRLPKRADGEQIVAVADFNTNGMTNIKTAWLNKATDNHQSGLDTTNLDWRIEGLFGTAVKGMFSEYYYIELNGKATKVVPNRNKNSRKR